MSRVIFFLVHKCFIKRKQHLNFQEAALVSRNVFVRRFSSARLFTAGRILHIVRRKRMGIEKLVVTCQYLTILSLFLNFNGSNFIIQYLIQNIFVIYSCLIKVMKKMEVKKGKIWLKFLFII